MRISNEKLIALLGAGFLALTLSACGADEDSPDNEQTEQEQFDTFEDEPAPDSQNDDDVIQEEQSATPQDTGDPDTAPDEDDPDDGATMNEETQDIEDEATKRGGE